jgi:hypothetical protein
MTTDPTREEMLAFLASVPFADELEEFDREEAAYWFAYLWHGGASSNLYAVLCQSPFRPGPTAKGPSEGGARYLFEDLEEEFAE